MTQTTPVPPADSFGMTHPLTAKEKELRDWLREQPGGAEKWLLIKAGFRRSYDYGMSDAHAMHQAYRPEVVAEVAVHLGSHEDWDEIAQWCGGRIDTAQDPSGEYSSTLVLPNGERGGDWAWLVLDHTGEFHIRAEVEAPSARSIEQIKTQALAEARGGTTSESAEPVIVDREQIANHLRESLRTGPVRVLRLTPGQQRDARTAAEPKSPQRGDD